MWVKFSTHESKFVILPYKFNGKIKKIKFGTLTIDINTVNSLSSLSSLGNYLTIKLPNYIKSKLHLDIEIKYQFFINDETLVIGPLVGLLLNKDKILNEKRLRSQIDRLGIYNNIGGIICAFTLDNIDFDKQLVTGYYYKETKGWIKGVFPIPTTIYRRCFNSDKLLTPLKEVSRVFNSNELALKDLLNESTKEIVLQKDNLINLNIIKELNKLKKVRLIAKDDNLKSYILEKQNDKYYIENSISLRFNNKRKLLKFIKENKIYLNYSIQKYYDKTTINGQDYMLRCILQKGYTSDFTVTGIEVIANKEYELFDTLIKSIKISKEEINTLIDKIKNVCIDSAESLDNRFEIVEIALYVVLDKNKKVWLVDIDTRPNFLSFKKVSYYTYLNMRYQPLIYATKISGFKLLDAI